MSRIASRIANGATIPSTITGGANSSSVAKNDPITAPADSSSSPLAATSRIGRETNGMSATSSDARSTSRPSKRGDGSRSAMRPPSQYPTLSEASVSPMMFAQTIVEEP